MRLVDLDGIAGEAWREVVAGEAEPFGAVGETLRWRDKSRHIGVRDDAGALVAMGGLVVADVHVGTTDLPLQVVGIGGVIVTRAARERGIGRMVIERLLEIAPELGPERAMLFCTPANVGLYARFGFQLIEEPVWVSQPEGPVEMPMRTMWRALAPEVGWPAGRVALLDQPF